MKCLFFLLAFLLPQIETDSLANRTIAVMMGSVSERYVQQAYPSSKIGRYDEIMDAFTALLTRKADYVLTAFSTCYVASEHNPSLKILPEHILNEGAFIGTAKNNPRLTFQVDSIIKEWLKDGTMDEIISHWITESGQSYVIKEFENAPTQNPPLHVATSANREPMSFIRNNKWAGMDWEISMRLGEALNRQVVVQDMKFSSMIAAVQSGKADLIASNLAYTQEREQQINYSTMYFSNPQVFCVRDDVVVAKKSFFTAIRDGFENNVIKEDRYLLILSGLKITLYIAFGAGILGTFVAMFVCALRLSRRKWLQNLAIIYITLFRGIPQVVTLMIMYYLVLAKTDLSAQAVAIITFTIIFSSYTAEIFRTAVTSVPKGQREAGLSLGFSSGQTFMKIILPQASRMAMPVFKGEIVSLIKMTSIVGYIAVQDLTKASDIIRSRTFDAFLPLVLSALIYLIIIWIVTKLIDWCVREKSKR